MGPIIYGGSSRRTECARAVLKRVRRDEYGALQSWRAEHVKRKLLHSDGEHPIEVPGRQGIGSAGDPGEGRSTDPRVSSDVPQAAKIGNDRATITGERMNIR